MSKSQKTLQKELSKERILNVAIRLFKKQGFKATGIDQIMRDASLTAGAFYAHFKSKEDLFEQGLEMALAQSRSSLTKETENLVGPEKNAALLKRYCSVGHRDLPDRGCVLPSLASEIPRGSKNASRFVAIYLEKWVQMISENLDSSMSGFEKREFALQLISRSVGSILLSRLVKETALSEQILAAAQKFTRP